MKMNEDKSDSSNHTQTSGNGYGLIGKLITSVLKCIQLKLTNDHPGEKTGSCDRLSITQRKGYPALELWPFRCEPKTENSFIIMQKFIKHDLISMKF